MLTGVPVIKHGAYLELLKFNIKNGGNILVLGQAGIGKTEMALDIITAQGYEAIYVNLSVIEYPDLVGLQTVTYDETQKRKIVEYAAPRFMRYIPLGADVKTFKSKRVMVFDELDKAKDELQNPLLEVLLMKRLNGECLDMHASVLTGNLPDENAFSKPISHALTNRCQVYKLEPEWDIWQEWAVTHRVNPLVIGFLSREKQWFSMPTPEGDPTAYNRPSPRSWSLAGRDLDATEGATADTDMQTAIVAGRVGAQASIEFRVWLDHYRTVEPHVDALVKHGKRPELHDLDKIIVCAIMACNEVSRICEKEASGTVADKDKMEKQVLQTVENVFTWVASLNPDVQICAAKSTMVMPYIQKWKLTRSQVFMKTFQEIKKAFGGK